MRRMRPALETCSQLCTDLIARRPSVVRAGGPALDRSLTLAAAAALGDIAWRLWRRRESTNPLLSLQRFGDLSARVCFTSQTVKVIVPLGRRSSDLAAHGFLDTVEGVPWLEGRTLEFIST